MDEWTEEEWEEWCRLTPLERWAESQKLWAFYLSVGGSLDPEPDPQSPFYVESEPSASGVDEETCRRLLRAESERLRQARRAARGRDATLVEHRE